MVDTNKLYQLSYQTLLELSTEEGINASGKNDVFGCIFGRDSALTILKILRAHTKRPHPELLDICKRALITLTTLQGKEFNIESGEQPGKFIHEFRKENFEHLANHKFPWFIYPDGLLRNYDSIDSTPLNLIAIYQYWQATKDDAFLVTVLPNIEAGLNWIITYGDMDKDQLIEYEFPPERKCGGLVVQSWTDSHETLLKADGTRHKYPIAPVEVQAYAWLALKLWADFYITHSPSFAQKLSSFADDIKKAFNERFILRDNNLYFAAQGLEGYKSQIPVITANPMLCLWAAYQKDGKFESVVDESLIEQFVQRVFLDDMFVENAGIRTMSSLSPTFNPRRDSYHNGSFWPILNGLIAEGLENFKFYQEAQRLIQASLVPVSHFNSPIELYIKEGDDYFEYCSPTGQISCHEQAWSAAAVLDMTVTSSSDID